MENYPFRSLEQKIDNLSSKILQLSNSTNIQLSGLSRDLSSLSKDLNKLRCDFDEMVNDQRKKAALQKALTELVTVRQEIQNKYGNYQVVRDNMLGVLQATDAALVRKTTISHISEELMLSTPRYWLAPCLVAIAAWINNDRDLANRAIREAVKRDKEQTALTMALICRRNNRIETCYEWLSIYFSTQNSANFSEASMVYVTAYVNGVFGPDKWHMCDDYINKWINEVRSSNARFEHEQIETWKNHFKKYCNSTGNYYPNMKEYVSEFSDIDSYIGRIGARNRIKTDFKDIENAYVDMDQLRRSIDDKLIELVSQDTPDEKLLRQRERYLTFVKQFDGDEARAAAKIKIENTARREETKNLVERMSGLITNGGRTAASEKKTALSFLHMYINKGYEEFMNEKEEAFPKAISMNIKGWQGKTQDGSNKEEMKRQFHDYITNVCESEVNAEMQKTPNQYYVWMMVAAAMGILFAGASGFVSLVIAIVVIVYCFYQVQKFKENKVKNVEKIRKVYSDIEAGGLVTIDNCVKEWNAANKVVEMYRDSDKMAVVI